ncbi:MAG: DUF2158 domain-containing protein [Pseudolabrys sp.]|nr:DUF2158 domain-containing protein [Pseudolabrys sp.]
MAFAAGDVVILKSGGEPMTVVSVENENAVCLWTGDDGDLFRETIPVIALQAALMLDESDDEDAEADEDDEDEEEKAA